MHKILAALVILFSLPCFAQNTDSRDSAVILSNNSARTNEFMFAVKFLRWWEGGVFYLRNSQSEFYIPRFNFILNQWNNENSRGSVGLAIGLGSEKFGGKIYTANLGELSANWENSDYMVSLSHLYVGRDNLDNSLYVSKNYSDTRFRVGVSPYKADPQGLNIWLTGQFDRQSNEHQIEFMQVVRFLYKEFYWEIGAGFNGNLAFNFMTRL